MGNRLMCYRVDTLSTDERRTRTRALDGIRQGDQQYRSYQDVNDLIVRSYKWPGLSFHNIAP